MEFRQKSSRGQSEVASDFDLLLPQTSETPKTRSEHRQFTRKRWSSFQVKPGKILSTLMHYGMLIPTDAQDEIEVLRDILHADRAELSVINKELVLHNLVVGRPGQDNLLRVQKVFVRWDSFTQPCLDVVLSGVQVYIEFFHLRPSKNNWGELKHYGMAFLEMAEKAYREGRDGLDAFLRVSSVAFVGEIGLTLASRPLQKVVGSLKLKPDELKDLSKQIQILSDVNTFTSRRRGCSLKELTRLVQGYFDLRVHRFMSDRLNDIANNPGGVIKAADHVIGQAGEVIWDYAGDLRRRTMQKRFVPTIGKLCRTPKGVWDFKERSITFVHKNLGRLPWQRWPFYKPPTESLTPVSVDEPPQQ